MTAQQDLGQRLIDHFQGEAPREAPDRVLKGAMLTIETTQQRRIQAPWRITHMPGPLRVIAVTAAALAIILGSLHLVPRASNGSGTSPSANAGLRVPTACPAASLPSGSIATIAGTGEAGNTGDGGLATEARVDATNGDGGYGGIAVDPTGVIYLSIPNSRAVRRIDVDGVITTLPGTGASLVFPMGLAIDATGRLYVDDPGLLSTPHIWRLETDGTLTAVAGNGTFGTTGNNGPALQAEIQSAQMAIGPAGDLYFDDNNSYRTVDPAGIIHAYAGTGVAGFSGDGGPAIAATLGLSEPYLMGVAADATGNVYLGDPANHRIRKVDPSGTITTVVGTGVAGYSGDTGPATNAEISAPGPMAVDPEGNVFFADDNSTVRKVDVNGIITTVAGTGEPGYSGDCGPAISAQLDGPSGITIRDGVLYIVDGRNRRVRVVVP